MLINRDDAVKAVEALKSNVANFNDEYADEVLGCAIEAIRALPVSDGVTDEMVERAARAIRGYAAEHSEDGDTTFVMNRDDEIARAALEAALGATVSDGWEDIREQVKAIYAQSECLEKYAEGEGFSAKPVPSVFHIQAAHFRAYANRIEAALGPLPAPPTIE